MEQWIACCTPIACCTKMVPVVFVVKSGVAVSKWKHCALVVAILGFFSSSRYHLLSNSNRQMTQKVWSREFSLKQLLCITCVQKLNLLSKKTRHVFTSLFIRLRVKKSRCHKPKLKKIYCNIHVFAWIRLVRSGMLWHDMVWTGNYVVRCWSLDFGLSWKEAYVKLLATV